MPNALRRLPSGSVLLGLLVLLALALRLPTAGEQSYWLDEVYSAQIVGGSLGHAWSTIQVTENTPPLYYLLGWGWTQLFGHGELGLRSLSAVAGALAIVPTVWLTRTAGERGTPERIALLAGVMLAVNPMAHWFSQEARSYGLLILLGALAWAALAAALVRPTPGRLWLWTAAAVAVAWTHYFGAILLVVGGAALVVADRLGRSLDGAPRERSLRSLAPPLLASVVGAAGLIPIATRQHSTSMYEAIAGVKGLGARIIETPKQFAVGYNAPTEYVLGGLIALVLVVLVAAAAWPRDGRATRGTVLLGLTVAVWAVPLLALVVGFDVVLTRNFVLLLPALAALAALGAWRLGRRAVWLLVAVAVVQLAIVLIVQVTPADQRDDWRGALRAADGGPGAELLVVSRYQPIAAQHYAPTARQVDPAVPLAVRSIAIVDRPVKAGEDAPRRVAPPPPPAPGMRLVRQSRNAQYRVLVWRAAAPVQVTPGALLGLLPDGGPRVPVLRP